MDNEMNVDLAVLFLTGRATDEEIKEFDAWLNASEANRKKYYNWAECWEATGKTYQNIKADIDGAWNTISKQTVDKHVEKVQKLYLSRRILKVAASITLILALAGIANWLYKTNILQKEILTTYSSGPDTLSVRLPDGTMICLNEYSILKAPIVFKKHNREVYLDGEAFFDVAKNPKRPFKIFAWNTVTEVLGTSFNLKAKLSDNLEKLTVLRGKVAFYKRGDEKEKLILFPKQQGIYNNTSGLLRKDTVKDMNMLAWKTKKLYFKNAPLAELCSSLSGLYNKKIIYRENYSLAEKELFTGSFNNLPLEDALSIVEMTLNVNINRERNIIEISYK